MALPNGVSIPSPIVGRTQFVTQRGYFAPPYVSCMFAALCSILIWMGYELPLERDADNIPPENFVWKLHKNSGAALNKGTTVGDTKTAMANLLPDAPMLYGSGTDAELIALLEDDAAIRVAIKCPQLTTHLRRWVGTDYTGTHAVAIVGTRMNGGTREVFWLDPMGRPSQYSGEWVAWSDVTPAITKNASNEYIVTWGYKGTAVVPEGTPDPDPDPPPDDPDTDPVDPPADDIPEPPPVENEPESPVENIVAGQRGTIPAGTPVFHFSSRNILYYLEEETEIRIYGNTEDGEFYGMVSRTSGTEGTNPKLVLVPIGLVTNIHT